MASAEKRGKVWRVRYKKPDGTWGSESGFPTKTAAMKRGNDLEADLRNGRYVDPRKSRTIFADWVPVWMAAQSVAPGTVDKRRRLLKAHLLPKWGNTPINEINLFAAKAWANHELKCAESTRGHALTLLSMIITGAVDAGMLNANPLYGRRIAKSAGRTVGGAIKDEKVWVQPPQAVAVARRLSEPMQLMVITAAWTGMRWGELAGLHRSNCLLPRHVQLEDGTPWTRWVLRVDAALGALHEVGEERPAHLLVDGGPETRTKLYLGPPKNVNSVREIDLPPFLVSLLRSHLAVWPHDYPFSTPRGKFWRRPNFGRTFRPAADGRPMEPARQGTRGRKAWSPVATGLTMHGLRHSHDTWMKDDKVDRALRFQVMGWAVQDIEGTYEHVTPDMRWSRIESLQARWERANASLAVEAEAGS